MEISTIDLLQPYLKMLWRKWPWTERPAACMQISVLDSSGSVSLGK